MAQTSPHQVVFSDEQRRELERRAAAYSGSYRDVVRAKAILLAAEGLSNTEIAERLGQSRQAVSTWRRRFCEEGLQGLEERPRPACRAGAGGASRDASSTCRSPAGRCRGRTGCELTVERVGADPEYGGPAAGRVFCDVNSGPRRQRPRARCVEQCIASPTVHPSEARQGTRDRSALNS